MKNGEEHLINGGYNYFVSVFCCSCGVTFMISKPLYDFRRSDGREFYCPNGHSQHYESEIDKVKKTHKEELAGIRRELVEANEMASRLHGNLMEKERQRTKLLRDMKKLQANTIHIKTDK